MGWTRVASNPSCNQYSQCSPSLVVIACLRVCSWEPCFSNVLLKLHTQRFSLLCKATRQREGTVTFPCDVGQRKSWDCSLPAPTSASSHVHSIHLTLLSEVIALCLSAWKRELDRPWDQGFPGSAFTRPGLGETPGSKEPAAHHVRPPQGPSRVEGNCPSVVQSLRLTPQTPHPLRPAICGDTCRCGPSRRSTA